MPGPAPGGRGGDLVRQGLARGAAGAQLAVVVAAPAPERGVRADRAGVRAAESGGGAGPAGRRPGDLLGQAGARARAVAQFAAGAAVVAPAPERVALADAAGEVPARGDMDPSRRR